MASADNINFSGLASGIDTRSIVDALIEIERQPVRRLEQRRTDTAERQSLFQEFNTLLLSFRDAARDLDNLISTYSSDDFGTLPLPTSPSSSLEEEFLAFKAESSDEDSIAITNVGSATPGSFDLTVTQLANVARRVSVGYTAGADTVASQAGTGTLNITAGVTTPLSLDVTVDALMTLDGLKTAINQHEDNDGSVRAEIITISDTEVRLVVSGAESGTDNNVTVSGLTGFLDPDVGGTIQQDAQDAQFSFAGLTLSRSSNEVSDAIPGVTFELKSVSATPTTLSITRDDEAITERLQTFVDAYNAIVDFSDDKAGFDAVTQTQGLLFGNPTVRTVVSDLQRALSDGYNLDAAGTSTSSLGLVGLSFNSGKLSIDATKLKSALDDDVTAVRRLFNVAFDSDGNEAPGVAAAIVLALEPVVRVGDGILAALGSSVRLELDSIDDQLAQFEARIALRETTLTRRFSAMERVISNLRTQSSFLGAF